MSAGNAARKYGQAVGGANNVTYPDGSVGLIPEHANIVEYGYTKTYVTTGEGKRIFYSEDFKTKVLHPLSTSWSMLKNGGGNDGFRCGYDAGYNGNSSLYRINIILGPIIYEGGNTFLASLNAGYRSGSYDARNQYENWLKHRFENIPYY